MLKNVCLQTLVLEKTLESPLDSKKIKPINSKGNQSWIFIGRTDAEAETPMLCPPDKKRWLIGKDPDAGKDWRQEEKGTTEDERVGWHHWSNRHESEQTLGNNEEQGSLLCCSPCSCKETDRAEQLNNSNNVMTKKIMNEHSQYEWSTHSVLSPSHTVCCYSRPFKIGLDMPEIYWVNGYQG